MGSKLTREVISSILLCDSDFKDDDNHQATVDNVAGVLYKHIKPFDYRTYTVMLSKVVNGLTDGVYEAIQLHITLEDRSSPIFKIKTDFEFNNDHSAGLLFKIDKV
ncbi:hypothetical protein [Pseudomonas sp. HY7a-MNA-CIBAN-0227]|uniref:hypothetical protein n=1 Tax=Pseudomonas sp. HY7a-MNA-CIBAN-0227 TaxID=3140474 RepID=UPI00331FB884